MWTLFLPAVQIAKRWCRKGKVEQLFPWVQNFAFPAPILDLSDFTIHHWQAEVSWILAFIPLPFAAILWINYLNISPYNIKSPTGVDKAVDLLLSYENALAETLMCFHAQSSKQCLYLRYRWLYRNTCFWKSKTVCCISNDGNITDHFDDSAPYHGFFMRLTMWMPVWSEINLKAKSCPKSKFFPGNIGFYG